MLMMGSVQDMSDTQSFFRNWFTGGHVKTQLEPAAGVEKYNDELGPCSAYKVPRNLRKVLNRQKQYGLLLSRQSTAYDPPSRQRLPHYA